MTSEKISRRAFLKMTSALSLSMAATPFAINLASMSSAIAATPDDYRALVFINYAGGNDTHNLILATDSESWSSYETYRKTDDTAAINLDLATLLPITFANTAGLNTGREIKLHPNLVNLKSLFDNNQAAIVASVGPLIEPTTALQYKNDSVRLPKDLFSHSSQTDAWQSYEDVNLLQYGWGGRTADLLLSQNTGSAATFTCISTDGNVVFLTGESAKCLPVRNNGLQAINVLFNGLYGQNSNSVAVEKYKKIITPTLSDRPNADYFVQDISAINQSSISAQVQLKSAFDVVSADVSVGKPTTNSGIANDLETVLKMIASASALGDVKRQVFYVTFGGFDTHDNQIEQQGSLMKDFDDAIGYFMSVCNTLGLTNKVTVATGSEFGRTFTSNGDGTDHGWGSHHFVIGGAVKGGDIYGRFPTLGVNNNDNVGSALLPQFSVDQYGATLAKWLGVGDSDLNDVFLNLGNFSTRDLGFMNA